MHWTRLLALHALLLVAFVAAPAQADTLRNRKTGETLDGKVLASTERDGKALLVVRLANGKTELLPIDTWEQKSETDALIKKLRSDDPKVREAALNALVKIGKEAVKHLEPLAQDDDAALAQAATRAILQIEEAMKPSSRRAAPAKKPPAKKKPARVWRRPPPPVKTPAVSKKKPSRPRTKLVTSDCKNCKGLGRVKCSPCGKRLGPAGGGRRRLRRVLAICGKCKNKGSVSCRTCRGRGKVKVRVNVPAKK